MDVNTILALVGLAAAVGVALWHGLSTVPAVRALESEADSLYAHDTTPAERAAVAAFVAAIKPEVVAAANGEAAKVEQIALGRAVAFAAGHGLHITGADLVGAVQAGIAEGPQVAAEKAVGAAVAAKSASKGG